MPGGLCASSRGSSGSVPGASGLVPGLPHALAQLCPFVPRLIPAHPALVNAIVLVLHSVAGSTPLPAPDTSSRAMALGSYRDMPGTSPAPGTLRVLSQKLHRVLICSQFLLVYHILLFPSLVQVAFSLRGSLMMKMTSTR